MAMVCGAAGENRSYETPEMYTQTLVITAGADLKTVPAPSPAPVYDAHRWALSTRWDDSNPNGLNIRRKMLEAGIHGTFYLNSKHPEKQGESLAEKLTGQGECSVGGHSVTHPHLPKLPANEAFYELMANRITLECLTGRPVNSLAFPYGGYEDKERPEVLQGISEAFLRTGYHHCVYANFVTRNPWLPPNTVSTGLQVVPGDRQVDAAKFWAGMDKIRSSEDSQRLISDCIFLGVHPWQQGEELEHLGELMQTLHDWDDFWHCTQTEYAAFTRQRRCTTIAMVEPGCYTIERPAAYELGNDIPLTLSFATPDVQTASVDGVACPLRHDGQMTIVNIPHKSSFGVPAKIDQILDGVSSKFPGLKADLSYVKATETLTFVLENASGRPMSDLRFILSLPPACDPGLRREARNSLENGQTWTFPQSTVPIRKGEYWEGGRRYFAAQLDFLLDGERGRLFVTSREAETDSSH